MVRQDVPLACGGRAVWFMLFADDASSVSTSVDGLAERMTVIVTVVKATALTVWENKTKTMLLQTPGHNHPLLHHSSSKQLARSIDRQPSS